MGRHKKKSSDQQYNTMASVSSSTCHSPALSANNPIGFPPLAESSLHDTPVSLSTDVLRIRISEPRPKPHTSTGLISVPVVYKAPQHVPFVNPFTHNKKSCDQQYNAMASISSSTCPCPSESSLFDTHVSLSTDVLPIRISEPRPEPHTSTGLISVPIVYRAAQHVPFVNPFTIDVPRTRISKPIPTPRTSSGLVSVPVAYMPAHHVPYVSPFAKACVFPSLPLLTRHSGRQTAPLFEPAHGDVPHSGPVARSPRVPSRPSHSSAQTGRASNKSPGPAPPNTSSDVHCSQPAPRSRRTSSLLKILPTTAHIFPIPSQCNFCKAKRLPREAPTFCCSSGKTKIFIHPSPPELWALLTGTDAEAKELKTRVRTYNNICAFTSFGVTYDANLCRRNRGIYTFKAQGQIYHRLNTLVSLDNCPTNLQLYFYDTEDELAAHLNNSNQLAPNIIARILNILKSNPYCQFFRSLSQLPNLDDCQIVIKTTTTLDQRVYNAPTSSQVAAIWVESPGGGPTAGREILVQSKSGGRVRVQFYYGCYDPMQYVLLLPFGEPGWHQGIQRAKEGSVHNPEPHAAPNITSIGNVEDFLEAEDQVLTNGSKNRDTVSCREYYSYLLQMRPDSQSVLLHSGRLLQQFVVDMYIKLESSRLGYFELNQKKIRADLYSGIVDSIAIGERRGFKIGTRIVLPATFIGGPRDMRRRYLDAMTLVHKFGKPDLFITMTCNPNWPEIKRELLPGEEAQNRPDLLARVFHAKFEELKHDVITKHLFGPVAGYVYVIEFQKRGLPHVHMLLILKDGHKIRTPEQFDAYVSAEIPKESDNPHLYRAVLKHMMHGPCGDLNPDNVCMKKNGCCKNHYPKEYRTQTSQTEDSYPLYRRRDDNQTAVVRGKVLDNRWVIPYNAYLLAKFDCHINVEICSTIKAVKYLYKYIYKGHDRVSFNVIAQTPGGDVDEISTFRDARWISPPEAMWRIYRFTLNEISPAIFTLQLHLEHQQMVTYASNSDLQDVLDNSLCSNTTLTEFFEMNRVNPAARKWLYEEFPHHFVWNRSTKKWQTRKRGLAVGRVVTVSPMEGDRYYLKLLLGFVRGPTCYDDLKRVNGVLCKTFMDAATLHGLCLADDCFRVGLHESCTYRMPPSLRRLFATILVYCNPVNARLLWEEFAGSFSEDFARFPGNNQQRAMNQALLDIGHQVETMGKNINDYCLTDERLVVDAEARGNKEISDERNVDVPVCDLQNIHLLNSDQRAAYDQICACVVEGQHKAFFVDGPGGTGKSFLYAVLLAQLRSKGYLSLATASSGVAAAILPGGRTAHSRFKIPITTEDPITCSVKKQSGLAKLLRSSHLIVWDEAPMVRRQAIEAFERMLRDVCDNDLPYGGKVVVFGGDFRQVLPIVPKGSVEETILTSLVKSPLWPALHKLRLVENMRARLDPIFSEFLLKVGEGKLPAVVDDEIAIPVSMCLPYTGPSSLDELIDKTFPHLEDYSTSLDSVINRTILTTRNDFVQEINDTIIDRFPGEYHEYRSIDRALDQKNQGLQEDFFNSMTPSGFPPHILKLKLNCPVILLRNLDPSNGLCNGTRLTITSFGRHTLGAVIATGNFRGKHVFLPRIPLTPTTSEVGIFPFSRMQFPIRLCFCMTINKAQGHTLDFVGIYLPQSVFSHGQLYVAMSRARMTSSLAILIVPREERFDPFPSTRNVVYREVLRLASNCSLSETTFQPLE